MIRTLHPKIFRGTTPLDEIKLTNYERDLDGGRELGCPEKILQY